MRRLLLTFPLLALAACGHHPGREFAAQTPAFDAASFFAGETEGVGTLHRVLRRPKQMVVRGTGRYVDGRLLLTQRILIQDEPPRSRTFDLHRVAPGQWRGTLSDGSGPVTIVSQGNELHMRYPDGTGYAVNQFLYLRPDGRTAIDRTQVTSFGDDWAKIDATYRHLD
jgi:hypothetical protein